VHDRRHVRSPERLRECADELRASDPSAQDRDLQTRTRAASLPSRVLPSGLKGTTNVGMAKRLPAPMPANAAIADALERYASLLDLAGAGYYTVRAYRRAAELIRPLDTPVAELVRSARVRDLRGIGPGIEARLRALVETGEITHARELDRARELAETTAGALGCTPAGDPRRWKDVSNRFAVVCTSADVLDRFAALPQIVSVVSRDDRRALGVTVEGVPVEVVVAEPKRFGT